MIGRDTERAAVVDFLDEIAAGPTALLITGEPGIGKTTLWRAAVARARQVDYLALDCRPTSADGELPFVGLADLLAKLPDEALTNVPSPQRRALDIALLRVDAGFSPLEQRAVSTAVLLVLEELARSGPLLLAIDDLQWLDSPTVRVLRFALRRIGPVPIGVLAASRTGPNDGDLLGLADSLPADRIRRITLGPLDLMALDRILDVRLNAAFLGPTLRRVHETSAGNPFFAIELGRALLDPNAYHVPGQEFPAPASLTDLLTARLAGMSPPGRRVLLATAALTRPTVDLVVAVSGDETGTRHALDEVIDAGIVGVQRGAVRFSHPLLASAVYAQASTSERKQLHGRLAELVSDLEEQARHLALSVDPPDLEVAERLERAACRATARGAPDVAAALFEQATEFTPPAMSSEVLRLTMDTADQHIMAGDLGRARIVLDGVLATVAEGSVRARALHRCARISTMMSEFLTVPRLLKEALEQVADDLPLRAAVERDLVWSLAQVGTVKELLPHAEAALEAAEATGEEALIAETLDHLCLAQCFAGEVVDASLLERAIHLDARVGMAPTLANPGIAAGRLTLALTLKWTDDFDAADRLLEALRAEHLRHGDEGALTPVLFHLGELKCWAGDVTAAAHIAGECHHLATRSDQLTPERRAVTLDAMVASHRGDPNAAAIGAEALRIAELSADWPATIRTLRALGQYEMSVGNAEGAAEHLANGVAEETLRGYDRATVRIVPDAVEALLAVDRRDEAAALVEELEQLGARCRRPWALVMGERCRGLLEAADGNLIEAQAALERALREHDRLPQPFERGRTLLSLGSVQRRARQQRSARQSLDEACRIFAGLGAVRWVERAGREVGRIGGRASDALALTPTEEQVAKLVADGNTNHEVATALFISDKTVEANLTRIYRKLGVSTRRELTRYLREVSSTQPPTA